MNDQVDKPRNVAGAIARGSDCWGRAGDVDHLWRMLERGSVLLLAPRRHGKSSLMTQLRDAPRTGWSAVYIDVEYVEAPHQFLTELAAAVLSRAPIRRLLKGAKGLSADFARWTAGLIDTFEIPVGEAGALKMTLRDRLNDPPKWRALAEELLVLVDRVDKNLLIIVDEFPMMVGNFLDHDQRDALVFLSWFRGQRQQQSRCRFLLGGSVNIEPRLEELSQSAVLNDLERFRLRPFSHEQAREFVAAVLTAEGATFTDDVATKIVEVADTGVPFFLQVLIAECLSEARERRGALDADRVEPVYRERVLGPENRARFSHLHTRLRTHYGSDERPARAVLSAIARHGERTESELRQDLSEAGFRPSRLESLLLLLEADYYIERRENLIRFPSGFLRDWWIRNAPDLRGNP